MTKRNGMKRLKKTRLQTRHLLLIFLSVAVLMISSAIIELNQSKKELQQLMTEQSHSLLESLLIASQNILKSNELLSDSYRRRLLNNASMVKILYENGAINNRLLRKLASENQILHITIFNKSGRKIFTSYPPEEAEKSGQKQPVELLEPVFSGQSDTLILGLRQARLEKGFRYVIALAAHDRSAIVLTIDAGNLMHSGAQSGFGNLLRNVVAQNPHIIFATLQDTTTILAASGNVRHIESITESPFLQRSFKDSLFLTRISHFDSVNVFEAVHPFAYNGVKIGLFRLGLSLRPIDDINDRIYRRLFFITLLLVLLGSFMMIYIFTRQRYDLLQKEYAIVETYSGNIIQNVSDAIIVASSKDGIRIFNQAAEKLFEQSSGRVLGKSLDDFSKLGNCSKFFTEGSRLNQVDCVLRGMHRYLLISNNTFKDSEGVENSIFVIRDLTRQKLLEEQLKRKERLTAMGELAAGVAHEIRNPLNTIATIVQQLDKDFEPQEHNSEYHELAGLVYSEVKRINQTIQDFLRFSRPEPVQPTEFALPKLLDKIILQYTPMARERSIEIQTDIQWSGTVFWDRIQMEQVIGNLIRNALDAINHDGRVNLSIRMAGDKQIEIIVSDNGPGMTAEIREKIFNLYYTTKASGTGIGLSIVQRIVDEHNGVIRVNSAPESGSQFTLLLPQRCCTDA